MAWWSGFRYLDSREAEHTLVWFGLPPAHLLGAVMLPEGDGGFLPAFSFPLPDLKFSMLTCKEIRIGGLKLALRISHLHIHMSFLLLGLTLWGAVPVDGS